MSIQLPNISQRSDIRMNLDIPKLLHSLNKGRQRSISSPAGRLPSQQCSSDRRLLFQRLCTSPVIWYDEKSPKICVNSCQIWLNLAEYCEWFAYFLWLELFISGIDTMTRWGLIRGHIPGPVEASPKAELIGVMMMHIGMPTVASKRSKRTWPALRA